MTALTETIRDARPEEFRNPPENEARSFSQRANVSHAERLAAGVAGAALLMWSLARDKPCAVGLIGSAACFFRAATGYCPLYDALGINNARSDAAAPEDYYDDGIHVQIVETINKPAHELYEFWRDFENLPQFMRHLESVQVEDDVRSHWIAKAPAGSAVEWDAEIIHDEADKVIAWRSLAGADVDNAGSVRFVENGNGSTQVTVTLNYIPPAGKVGSAIARLFGESPELQIREDLARFKQLMETGQVSHA